MKIVQGYLPKFRRNLYLFCFEIFYVRKTKAFDLYHDVAIYLVFIFSLCTLEIVQIIYYNQLSTHVNREPTCVWFLVEIESSVISRSFLKVFEVKLVFRTRRTLKPSSEYQLFTSKNLFQRPVKTLQKLLGGKKK